MNKREILEKIIENGGRCLGAYCNSGCPLRDATKNICIKKLHYRVAVEQCKRMLAEMEEVKMSKFKFKNGDDVLSLRQGWGTVVAEDYSKSHCMFNFPKGAHLIFRKDGRFQEEDEYPSAFTREEAAIKFPEYPAPKRKVKKTLERWANIYYGGETMFFSTKSLADKHDVERISHRVDCVKVLIEYEVDEE